MATVTTKTELKNAIKRKDNKIIVQGELAASVYKSKKVAALSGATLLMLAVVLAATLFTGGISLAAVGEIAAMVGVGISAIIAVVAVGGIAVVVALFKDYGTKITHQSPYGSITELELTKKRIKIDKNRSQL